MNIIQQIDEIRELRSITKKDLCAHADITVEYYIKVLKGKHSLSINVLENLADYLQLKITISLWNKQN